jgi:mono/diheme cytochrome c family protein
MKLTFPLLSVFLLTFVGVLCAQKPIPSLKEVRAAGRLKSALLRDHKTNHSDAIPTQQLDQFRKEIAPVLKASCAQCHGADLQEGEFRVDTLNPDLVKGEDLSWWLEVSRVLSNGEMPPAEEAELTDDNRAKMIDWLSSEIQIASQIRRNDENHSSFRRMTRYEYNYALQDLLGLPYDFAKNLPPETFSEDGFQNSSEMLHISAQQFETYRSIARTALQKATVTGDQPEPIYYGITMQAGFELMKKLNKSDKFNSRNAHFLNRETGEGVDGRYNYRNGKYTFFPQKTRPELPAEFLYELNLPAGKQQKIDVGNFLPPSGTALVRVRASKAVPNEASFPTLRLLYGQQASNNSHASERLGPGDQAVRAEPDSPDWYEWEVPLSEVLRNPFRTEYEVGGYPNPTEYFILENAHQDSSLQERANIRIEYLEVIAPYYKQWPPESHTRIFIDSQNRENEKVYAAEVLDHFMSRAWRRPVTDEEVAQKIQLFMQLRPGFDSFQETMIEVLAAVLSSPKFLYLVQADETSENEAATRLNDFELATRLTMFLWCSTPDQALLDLAKQGQLSKHDVLMAQTERMLEHPRARRFSRQFVRQWLGMQLLDYLKVDQKVYRQFTPELKESMQEEPIAFFQEILESNQSIMDFIHADYVMVNQRLAQHYRLSEVHGNHFRKVMLNSESERGGLLTQAGLLAMNSDGKDSHPLKRGIWLLESLLNDPPPPPPPAVPEIDLADPEILKMTLKERMEDHRSDPACFSCHARIDPWGIAFENFDAIGTWRDKIKDQPVDASSLLFNQQELDGMDGLKRFLLKNRQDQFARALVHKLTSFALGRPLSFADRSDIDDITAQLRKQNDGLKTLIRLIVTSELFLSK